MKNKFIKVTILIFVIAGITTAIILTQQSINKFAATQSITSFEFENYAKQMVDDNIIGSASNAKPHYVEIYDIIKTENSVRSNQGNIISQNVADECYNYAFSTYWKIYNDELSKYFNKSQKEWTSSKRNEMSKELKDLRDRNGSGNYLPDIRMYETYLTNYKKALDLIKRSVKCTNVDEYNDICKECKNYQVAPYTNASNLKNDLQNVPSNAQTSWKNFIVQEIDTLVNKDFSMDDDKSNFNSEYNRLKPKWTSYENKISNNDYNIVQAKKRLDDKSDYWTNYFRAKANQNLFIK